MRREYLSLYAASNKIQGYVIKHAFECIAGNIAAFSASRAQSATYPRISSSVLVFNKLSHIVKNMCFTKDSKPKKDLNLKENQK